MGTNWIRDSRRRSRITIAMMVSLTAFCGIACAWWSPNFEPVDYKDRPPFLAPIGSRIISLKKPVTASVTPLSGELKQVNDGDKNHEKESLVTLPKGLQWIQVDLQESFEMHAVLVWHFHHGQRVYFDVIGLVSDDPTFKNGVTIIYNNDYDNSAGMGKGEDKEYLDRNRGRLIDLKRLRGRYMRFYSNGNMRTDENNMVEIEVWGMEKSSSEIAKLAPLEFDLPEPFFGGRPL
jgi:hypothetical protein